MLSKSVQVASSAHTQRSPAEESAKKYFGPVLGPALRIIEFDLDAIGHSAAPIEYRVSRQTAQLESCITQDEPEAGVCF